MKRLSLATGVVLLTLSFVLPVHLVAQQPATPVRTVPARTLRLSPTIAQRLQAVVPRTNTTVAQVVTPTAPAVPVAQPPDITAATKAAVATSTNTVASPEERRLQDLLKLPYDRRPASVLKAMARKAEGEGAFTNDLERFQADVITSDWAAVRKFLAPRWAV
jgi:hypothetical protein